ncbi:MAG: lipopolysaccharide kinase InaA family protein [Burkholderiales bacterium]
MTPELESARPLDQALSDLRLEQAPLSEKRELIFAAAQAVRKMHLAHCQHRALFPKHVLVGAGDTERPRICIIDFEKARLRLLVHSCAVRDLDELNRRSQAISRTDRLRFFKDYLGVRKLDAWERLL